MLGGLNSQGRYFDTNFVSLSPDMRAISRARNWDKAAFSIPPRVSLKQRIHILSIYFSFDYIVDKIQNRCFISYFVKGMI